MAAKEVTLTGGDKLAKHLAETMRKLGIAGHVRVGFLENATYPGSSKNQAGKLVKHVSGLKVAQVAFWNEYGTTKAPPRPFFRNMIAKESPKWGDQIGKILKATGGDSKKALALMGENIKGQLVKSIVDFTSPPLAAYTIEKKGFDKPLIDTGVMQRAVDYEVGK